MNNIKKGIYLLVMLVILTIVLVPGTLSRYTSTLNNKLILNISSSEYTVIFHSNNGTDTTVTQSFLIGESKRLTPNTFTKTGYNFSGWNTAVDGSGTRYSDNELVTDIASPGSSTIDLYAQWADGTAMVNGTVYSTLQIAINNVPTDGVLTTVILLKSVNETITTFAGQNIEFDLGNNTISNISADSNIPTIENAATLHIKNGTITTNSKSAGAVNNRNNGVLYMTGGRIITTGKRQAIYNDNATVTISDNAYLESAGTDRAAFQNTNSGTATILGGTIISTGNSAVNNAGNFTIGVKNDDPDSNIVIRGKTYGVTSSNNFKYYDGVIYGKTKALNDDNKANNREEEYLIVHSKESIDGVNYDKVVLKRGYVVTFNPNKGSVSETSRNVGDGEAIGTLPTPTRLEYRFDGWYTELNGGVKITSDTIITSNVTYYAHWTTLVTEVAQIGTVKYNTLQDAFSSITTSTPTTITLLKNVNTVVTIAASKNITLDLNGNTVGSAATNNAIFENKGNFTILNGNISINNDITGINNSGTLLLNGVNITCNGTKQAVFVRAGTVTIDGNSNLSSNSSGASSEGTAMTRGTLHLLAGATAYIKSATITGKVTNAISNEGTIVLGDKDGVIDTSSIVIQGKTNGIENVGTVNFYDGIIKGITESITTAFGEIENNSHEVDDTEAIDGFTYQTKHLELD